ncbi:type II secretion system GspH family protein [Patescibacteria group bacterium]|nr:type II secretion system GspH family protein [Patescibacteria group bacterium]
MVEKKEAGFSLVEIIVSLAVFSVIIFAVIQLLFVSQEAANLGKEKTKAAALLSEYLEEVKNVRRQDWQLLTNGRYLIRSSSGNLVLEADPVGETVGDVTRYLEISNAYRDSAGNLVISGGSLDPSTKKVTAAVSWTGLHPGQLSQEIYLTRYFDNLAWNQTTVADFQAGQMDLVKIVDPVINDGELELVGGCFSESPESLIYDNQFRNGWRSDCSGLSFWQWLFCKFIQFFSNSEIKTNATDYTYNGSSYSIRIKLKPPGSGSSWSWVRIFNFNGVCTVGFRNLHFYVYNPSLIEKNFYVTAVYGQWDRREVVLPPGGWTEVSLDYETLGEGYEDSLQSIFFSDYMNSSDPELIFYVDQIELTGGVGGYFTEGTLVSSVLDTGRNSAFNRIGFGGQIPGNTLIGFQASVSDNLFGPWVFYGPGGTSLNDDLYTDSAGQAIWLGENLGRYFRYKAYLKSFNGKETPVLHNVSVNYSP